MDLGTTTKARTRRIARVSCARPTRDYPHSPRVRSVSKVNDIAAAGFGVQTTADLVRVSLRQAKDRLASLFTGQWSYGTELRAGVASPESNVFPAVLCTSAFPTRSAGAEAAWRDRAVRYVSRHSVRSVVTPGGPGTPIGSRPGPRTVTDEPDEAEGELFLSYHVAN